MPIFSCALDISILSELDRNRGPHTRSAYGAGLIRAALAAGLSPATTDSIRGRLPKQHRIGQFWRTVARKGDLEFRAFVSLYARLTAPILSLQRGTCEPEALALIASGAFEWTPEGKVRVAIFPSAPAMVGIPAEIRKGIESGENTLAGWSEIIAASGKDRRPRRERMGLEPGEHYQGCPLAGVSDDVSCCP